MLTALHSSHKEDNETMEGFNRRFNELIKSLPQDINPPENAILIFYVQAFEGEMRYQLKDKDSTSNREAQDKAFKIYKNMQAAGISSVLGFSKSSSLESNDVKKVENQEPQGDSIKELTRLIKQMELVYINQISAMHNKIVAMERDKDNNHKINDRWQKGLPKGPPYQEQEIPPEPLKMNNWFDDQIVKEKLAISGRMEQVKWVGHDFVFDSNNDLLETVEDNKDMVCMNRHMDKVE